MKELLTFVAQSVLFLLIMGFIIQVLTKQNVRPYFQYVMYLLFVLFFITKGIHFFTGEKGISSLLSASQFEEAKRTYMSQMPLYEKKKKQMLNEWKTEYEKEIENTCRGYGSFVKAEASISDEGEIKKLILWVKDDEQFTYYLKNKILEIYGIKEENLWIQRKS